MARLTTPVRPLQPRAHPHTPLPPPTHPIHTPTHPYAPSQDLSLRAFLKGWQFVWCYDMECPNEIPSDYKAYRKQQRRWSCGPMQLWAAARQSVRRSTLQPRCNHRAGFCDPMPPGCDPMHPGYDLYACRWVTATPYIIHRWVTARCRCCTRATSTSSSSECACSPLTSSPSPFTGETPTTNPDPNPYPNPDPNTDTNTNPDPNPHPNPHPNVTSVTFFYSVLVPLMLLEYAQEVEVEATHHRFMPWWAIAWSNPNPDHNPNLNPGPNPNPNPDPNPNPNPNPDQVGDRVAAAARDHDYDGLLPQLLPLHDPLRHVRRSSSIVVVVGPSTL